MYITVQAQCKTHFDSVIVCLCYSCDSYFVHEVISMARAGSRMPMSGGIPGWEKLTWYLNSKQWYLGCLCLMVMVDWTSDSLRDCQRFSIAGMSFPIGVTSGITVTAGTNISQREDNCFSKAGTLIWVTIPDNRRRLNIDIQKIMFSRLSGNPKSRYNHVWW